MSDIYKKPFTELYTFEERQNQSVNIKNKYPTHFPIVMQRSARDKILGDMDKIKYLVPAELSIADFMIILRKRLNVNSITSIYLFNPDNKIILSGSNSIGYLYNKYKNNDGFLYIEYCGENTFGYKNINIPSILIL